jgi:glucan phosphoethanolaminetransferase (alkaline phosphatase superfamily)
MSITVFAQVYSETSLTNRNLVSLSQASINRLSRLLLKIHPKTQKIQVISTGMSKQSYFHFFSYYPRVSTALSSSVELVEFPSLVVLGINLLFPVFIFYYSVHLLSSKYSSISIFYNYEVRFFLLLILSRLCNHKSILMLEELTLLNFSLLYTPRELARVILYRLFMSLYILLSSHIIVPTSRFVDILKLNAGRCFVYTGYSL